MNTKTAPALESADTRSGRTDPYQLVTEAILKHLENGVVPWHRPWRRETGKPRNYETGRCYRGVNLLLLGVSGFASPFWLTYRQVQALGGTVRKGEHGSMVVNWGKFTPDSEDADDQAKRQNQRSRYYLRRYVVFNAVQTEGIKFEPVEAPALLPESARIASAEQIVADMPNRPVIMEGRRDSAFYKPSTDTVHMPAFGSFESAESYHLTLFHELIHATGHQSRLNRKTLTESDGFGGKVYSQEELVAEIGAACLGMEAGIVPDKHAQSAAYIQCWLEALRETDHRRWVVIAASQAARAVDFVLKNEAAEPQTTQV